MATYRNLPSGYTQVEYIQSSGTQYIDTGMTLNQDSAVELQVSDITYGSYRLFGSRSSATSNNFSILTTASGMVLDFQNYNNNRLSVSTQLETAILSMSNTKLKANDLEQNVSTYTNFTTPETAYIFNGHGTFPNGYNNVSMKLYYCKIWQDNELVRDFVPCKNSSEVAGLYDVANNVFYQNVGTGTFVVGEEVDNNKFEEECKNYANCNRLGTIEILSSSTELTQDDKIQEFTIDSGCYVDGNIIGSVYVKKLETKLVDALNNTLENEEVDARVGVKFEDNSQQEIQITYTFTDEPVAGTKYIITNDQTTPSHSVNSNAGDTLLSTTAAPTDNAWYITPVDGGYTIQNVVTNKYLGITPTYTSGYITNVTLSINDEPTVWVYNTSNHRLTYSTTGLFARTYNFRYNNGWQTNTNSGSVYFASYNEPLTDEYVDLGKYIVEKPTDEMLENLTSFVAYEGIIDHIDETYTTELDYENETITLADVYEELCTSLGLTPITTTFTNSTITVANNPFTNGEKNRDVLSSILKVSGSILDVDNVNETIDLVWLSSSLDYTFDTDDYATLEGGTITYGPINSLVIKNSQIDDENVSRSDQESIAEYGEHKLVISEDYFLYDATLREAAIDDIWDKVKGTTYVDCKLTTYTGKPFLKIGNKIRVYTDENNYFDTYVLKHQFTFDGSFKSVIESPCLTEQEIKTKQDVTLGQKLRNTQIIVNKQEGEINAIVENVDTSLENQQALISGLQITTNGISESVTSLQGITQEQYEELSGSLGEYKQEVNGALNDLDDKFDGYVTTEAYGTFVQNVETSIGDTYTKTEINTKLSDGSVTMLQTTSLTADANGLTVDKTGAPTKSNLNATGLTILDRNDNPVLKAVYDEDINNTIVETHRHQVQEYFIMGQHSRFENYGDGTGCFYIN